MNRRPLASMMLVFSAVAPAQAQDLVFTDVTAEAGIDATYEVTPTQFANKSIMMAGGAVADFNRDGWDDIFILCGDRNKDRLYINNGDGTFTDRAAEWGVDRSHVGGGVCVGDYNGDGWPDIYITSMGPATDKPSMVSNILYRNNGDGTFTDVAEEAGVNALGIVDPDGFGAAFGDYDLDGNLDLVAVVWGRLNHGVTLFRGNGDGTFTRRNEAINLNTSNIRGFTPCFADMDGDGWPELIIAGDFSTSAYYVNNKNGTFNRRSRSDCGFNDTNAMGAVVADLTGDGKLDWFVSNICEESGDPQFWEGQNLFENLGGHTYRDIARETGVENALWAWGADACDLNNNGSLDLVAVNGWFFAGAMENRLWQNNNDGTWTEVGQQAGFNHDGLARGVCAFDYDRDGDLDLIVFNHGGGAILYRNDTNTQDNNTLVVKLDTLNRPDLAPDGVGSRMELVVDGVTQMRYVDGAPTYLSTGPLAEHFGLGQSTQADTLRVRWNDGTYTELTDLEANQILTVKAPPTCAYPDADGDTLPDFGDFDPTADGVIDADDLYAAAKHDVNGDGAVDGLDARCLAAYLRTGEKRDVLGFGR